MKMGKKRKPEVDLDYILIEIGEFGKYQMLTVLLVSIPVLFSVITGAEIIFSTQVLPHRCSVPECDGKNPEYEPGWISNAIPTTSTGSLDQCSRFVTLDNNTTDPGCPASHFNLGLVQSCNEYVYYERKNTVVYDFGLECQEWKRTLVGTVRGIGTLLVLPITGYISDRWGRRVALIVNVLNTGIVGSIRSWVTSYDAFLILQFLETSIGSGSYSSGFILATELVGPKYRVIAGVFMSSSFALGQVLLGFVAWTITDWRDRTRAIYAPQILIIVYFWLLFESVRWLLSKGKYSGADVILVKAAKMNGNSISTETLNSICSSATTKNKIDPDASHDTMLLWKIFKSKVMLRRMCTIPIWWVTNTLIYYGLSINSVVLTGNMYINFILVAAIEIPGYWTGALILDRLGRKMTLMIAYLTCAICCASLTFIPNSLHWLSLTLYLVGKFSISMVINSVYVYTAELLPTQHRHSLLAFSSMIGRIGGITASLTPALMVYWVPLPSLIFAVAAFLSACLLLTSPETLNTKMPDTFVEAEDIGFRR